MILAKRLMMCLPKAGWGDWILNSGVTVNTNGIAHYTAYKTNQREYYDSFADLDLTAAIVHSLHDADMQQWQAVMDAANELTGVTDWVINSAECKVVFTDYASLPTEIQHYDKYFYDVDSSVVTPSQNSRRTAEGACKVDADWSQTSENKNYLAYIYKDLRSDYYDDPLANGSGACLGRAYNKNTGENYGAYSWSVSRRPNPTYNSNATIAESFISFSMIAQKIISNASSSNQAISLLAEAYLENVAQSIFSTDESKQFVKLEDLIEQFELNKVLRV